MPSEVSFRSGSGQDPVERLLKIRKAMQPTEGDLLYAGQRQRTRILERTERGVDVDEHPFKPYSTKGPYYYYPDGKAGGSGRRAKLRKLESFGKEYGSPTKQTSGELKRMSQAASRLFRKLGGKNGKLRFGPFNYYLATLTRFGIKFGSYFEFKKALGRMGVDLRGARSPHMLQAIAVKTGNRQFAIFGDQSVGGANDMPNPADELVLGIYGEAAARATGHNKGRENDPGATVPQRRFFGASASDAKQMIQDIYKRMKIRMAGA